MSHLDVGVRLRLKPTYAAFSLPLPDLRATPAADVAKSAWRFLQHAIFALHPCRKSPRDDAVVVRMRGFCSATAASGI
ncbi:hypothetical protein [Tahibacter aquaticus]|uniref:hypothetical protein n=1 Tax=Tahibacter aquaticus TaxID=520092 RepID=UPI001414E45B|nr:hypothetical protein [Tahibacter aquaticus]